MKKKSKVEEVKEGSCGVNPSSKYFKHVYFDWVEDIKKARCRTYGTTINRSTFSPFLSTVTKTSSLRCRRVIKENQAITTLMSGIKSLCFMTDLWTSPTNKSLYVSHFISWMKT